MSGAASLRAQPAGDNPAPMTAHAFTNRVAPGLLSHPHKRRQRYRTCPAAAPWRVDLLTAFTCRADARAFLWSIGEYSLHEAADKLQADAERDGLIAVHGQDVVQQILANAFDRYREVVS
jgi:hypothetical protein